ncbi:MAG: class I SAM-dependent rRNA methyltransferase [Gemmataceae bacterium]|nr:class I SAM-dependent rRNA methyltransferase [Gemmataceae bacterium]MDW8266027.1 class I SAM-dependent rRNA methyltransferase [Gemmataceae bacterium]
MTAPRVILKPRRARPFFGRHPWVYAGAIAQVEGEPADGDVVDLHSHAGNFVGRGLWNSRSKIRVRLYGWSPDVPLDRVFFRERLRAAIRLRTDILGLGRPGQACRLVFSEADGLSGLTVDRYDRWLMVQFTALGLAQRRDLLVELLVELLQPEGIYLRTERGIGQLEGLELQDGPLWGQVPSEPVTIDEDGLRFLVHLTEGQKTGFYLDQRDNRRAVARLAAGRRVLDAFCYSGGFGLHAARAGATEVLGIDVSEPALALARANAQLNGLHQVTFLRDDVFLSLEALQQAGRKFDMVILDPPKFARQQRSVEDALRGYRRLQTLALRLLDPDGILVICCCSGLISMEMLDDLLGQLAVEERRDVQILEHRGQAPDHPVAATCLESNYLKCLICRVR